MGSFKPRHLNHYLKRNYEIVDIDTGEILKKASIKLYTTVNKEITYNNQKFVQNGRITEITTITNRRFVKHNGQLTIEI